MSTTKHFTNFEYIVRSDFLLENKREVIILFSYLDIHRIKLSLFINKEKGRNDDYYINEAKKIINQKIKDGSLEKYSEKCAKEQKRKKILSFAAPIVVGAMAIAGITVGTYFAINGNGTGYEITIPEIGGVSIDKKSIQSGKDLEATISVNNDDRKDNPQGLPHSLEVKVGDKVLSPDKYTYTLNPGRESGTIHIDASKINGPISFSFAVTDLAWYENHYYIDSLKKEDITKDDGVVKTLTVNGVEHKVRLIGVDEDYGKIGDESTKIHTTWEFANLLSDEEGFSLATQWNDTNDEDTANHNYFNSSIRKALTGDGGGHILWAQKGADAWTTDPLYKDKCVLDMFPSDLVSVLKAPSKYININDGGWSEQTVEDKLFLLSPAEMGRTGHRLEEPSTTSYSYYEGAIDDDRIKKQVDNEDAYTTAPEINDPGSGQLYDGVVYNRAGNNVNAGPTGYGGVSWLRSPIAPSNNVGAWHVFGTGSLSGSTTDSVNFFAYAVAPAFCI